MVTDFDSLAEAYDKCIANTLELPPPYAKPSSYVIVSDVVVNLI